eukprot:GDKJ01028108.1.p1 GENE.GDKJ01028108.1~~GDKJ01028108.1.p1  ORF type:complete len:458 (-),score=63.72 GDKJ01028108.1:72-1415(-)
MEYSRVSNTIAFLHPFCDMGGGGERVLWCTIYALLHESDKSIVIFTHTKKSVPELIKDTKQRFGIPLNEDDCNRIRIQPIFAVWLLLPETYPFATLIGQALGSMIFALINMVFFCPQRVVDTSGYPFTYPMFKFLGGVQVDAYTHYPVISTDMISSVDNQEEAINNKNAQSQSWLKKEIKSIYYRLFAFAYKLTGRCISSSNMTNSTWSKNHLQYMWGTTPTVIYPPANVTELQNAARKSDESRNGQRENWLVSLAQFRREKDQARQVRVFAKFVNKHRALVEEKGIKLKICGASRGEKDDQIVEGLKKLAKELLGDQYEKLIEFQVNLKWSEVLVILSSAKAAIHTMQREHFGISLVEYLAAGLVVIAHNSGGPKLDILKNTEDPPAKKGQVGFLCDEDEDFVKAIRDVFEDKEIWDLCRRNSKKRLAAFLNDEQFGKAVCRELLK